MTKVLVYSSLDLVVQEFIYCTPDDLPVLCREAAYPAGYYRRSFWATCRKSYKTDLKERQTTDDGKEQTIRVLEQSVEDSEKSD
jgi:hypothetical protein